MAIGTDSMVEFFGTQDSLDNTSGSVADGAFSAASDLVTWTNDDDALSANIILECTFSVAPDANAGVALFARPINIQGVNDQDPPDANFLHAYIGRFPVNDVTSAQFVAIDIPLVNGKSSQEFDFFLLNNAGQTISAGWDLHITPKTVGPHA